MKSRIFSLVIVVALIVMTLPAASLSPVQAASCKINVTTDPSNGGYVYIYDDTAGVWIEDGSNAESLSVDVECCHNYTVWVIKGGHTYKVKNYPNDWSVNPDGDKVSGHVDKGASAVHFHGDIIVANNPPVADADGPYEACVGEPITFDGSGSYDLDPDDTLEYRWDFDSDGSYDTSWSSSSNATHTWYVPYSGTVTLEVRDLFEGMPVGATDTDTAEVTVQDCTDPVIIDVTQSSDEPCAGVAVNITAHVTDDVGVTSVTLKYDSTEVAMTLDSGTAQDGYWIATIPGQPAGTTVTIYVTAYDEAENSDQYGPHDKTWIDCTDPVIIDVTQSSDEPCAAPR